jgi:hypothetical protein
LRKQNIKSQESICSLLQEQKVSLPGKIYILENE